MAFSFYQSLRTMPGDLDEVSAAASASPPWQRFWRLELPFAAPGLVWNTMMSMSGGWFFVVASEAITVGNTTVQPAGHRLVAGARHRAAGLGAVALAVGAMAVVILAYDQLLFRPIVAWADKFRFEQTAAQQRPRSWVYDLVRRTRLLKRARSALVNWCRPRAGAASVRPCRALAATRSPGNRATAILAAVVIAGAAFALWLAVGYLRANCSAWPTSPPHSARLPHAGPRRGADRHRQLDLGADRRVDRAAARRGRAGAADRAVPCRLSRPTCCFPCVVVGIVPLQLDPNIWLTPLMVLGTQWYILFNVDRRRQRLSQRPERGVGNLSAPLLAVVARRDPARHLPLLRHRRAHRLGRLVERQHRRRSRRAGATPSWRPRASARTSPRRPRRATFPASCSASP